MVAPQSPPTGLCIHFIDIGIGQVLTIILLFPKGSEPGAIAIAQSQQENQSRKSKLIILYNVHDLTFPQNDKVAVLIVICTYMPRTHKRSRKGQISQVC